MFNKIIIIGRVGNAPVTKISKLGSQFTSFSVAVDNGWGENKTTDWYNVTTFGKLAENVTKFAQKGSIVCVSGSLKLSSYKDKNGVEKAKLELTADSVNAINTQRKAQTEQSKTVEQAVEAVAPFADEFPF